MRKSIILKADIIVRIKSPHGTQEIETIDILDKKTGEYIDLESKPSLKHFKDADDMKESLCWCLNCDPDKYGIEWEGTRTASYGKVCLQH